MNRVSSEMVAIMQTESSDLINGSTSSREASPPKCEEQNNNKAVVEKTVPIIKAQSPSNETSLPRKSCLHQNVKRLSIKDCDENCDSSESTTSPQSENEPHPRQVTFSSTVESLDMAAATPPRPHKEVIHSEESHGERISFAEVPKEDHAFRTKLDSSYEGWDNPFRPEGELSLEADELLRLWKDGKLRKDANGRVVRNDEVVDNGKVVDETDNKQNGGDNKQNGAANVVSVKRDVVTSAPGIATKVNLDHEDAKDTKDPKKKKKGCCSVM